jgi:hypothetical protein
MDKRIMARLRPADYGAAAFALRSRRFTRLPLLGWLAEPQLVFNEPSLWTAAFALALLGEGWWSTPSFSTNEQVLNFFCEQTFGVLNLRRG